MSEKLSYKKKTIRISIIAIIIVAIIIGIIGILANQNKGDEKEQGDKVSKISQLYNAIENKKDYKFTATMNENNKFTHAKKDNQAYLETCYEGNLSKFIIKDGNTYLLMDERKGYYTYTNNETDLNKIMLQLKEVKDKEYQTGKEKIDNKEYQYEEYSEDAGFLMKSVDDTNQGEVKTKFYFKGKELVYIRTTVGEYSELLKIDISYNPDTKLFEIPADYKEL